MAPASHGLLGRIQRANDDASRRFGPNTVEVEAFINAVAQLTPWQWRQVLAARRMVSSITKEGTQSARAIQASVHSTEGRMPDYMVNAGEVLFDTLAKKSDEKQVAAWLAMSALVMRSHLPALKFAAHYGPFASLMPLSGSDVLDPMTRRFLLKLEGLTAAQCETLARRLRIEAGASHALLQAVAKHLEVKSEEAVALVALMVIPAHLSGDPGWAAVRTAVHGGRVLGCMPDLTQEQVEELWAPLEGAIPLVSLSAADEPNPAERMKSAVSTAIKTIKAPRTRSAAAAPARPPAPYGQNSAEVAVFIKGVGKLTAIQWLRVLDRRKLVASVTREGSAEPAGLVRSILAAIEGTRELDVFSRCRAFAAVERAGYAFAHTRRPHHGVSDEQAAEFLAPFANTIALGDVNGGFAHQIASLTTDEWLKLAAAAPESNEEALAPLVNAGTALVDFFGGISDDEAVAAWHAVSALVRRHHLTPIKFAASYAPFGSAIPVTGPRTLGAMVSRYVTALGRLSANQCAVLAREWQVDEDASRALSKATVDGRARPSEEAAALAAVVSVPMRLTGTDGWAAVKTATFGGKVVGSRSRLSREHLETLWRPIQSAIALSSLGSQPKTKR